LVLISIPAFTEVIATPGEERRLGFCPWYVIAVLMLIYTSSFIDRTIISLLVAPIRSDLGISDTQMSLVSGLSFAVFYTVLGIPLGRLADRYSRRVIIMTGLTLWSVMTMACGPTAIALVTDRVFQNDALLRDSLALVAGVAAPLAILFFRISERSFGHAVANARTRVSVD
jgi:MFS family permease